MCEGVFHSARCLSFSPSSSDGPLKHLDTHQLSSVWFWLFLWSASLFCLPDFTFTLLICCFLLPFWVCYLRWCYSALMTSFCHHLKLFISFWQRYVLDSFSEISFKGSFFNLVCIVWFSLSPSCLLWALYSNEVGWDSLWEQMWPKPNLPFSFFQ